MPPASQTATTSTTARTTLGLPVERFEQLKSLAKARDIAPAALVEKWIIQSVVAGEPGASGLPGYSAFRDGDVIVVTIAGRTLPLMDELVALLLATVLDGAAGTPNPSRKFELPTGRAVPIEFDGATLKIGRHGRGVVFSLESKTTHLTEKFATPSSYASDLADMIRTAIATH